MNVTDTFLNLEQIRLKEKYKRPRKIKKAIQKRIAQNLVKRTRLT